MNLGVFQPFLYFIIVWEEEMLFLISLVDSPVKLTQPGLLFARKAFFFFFFFFFNFRFNFTSSNWSVHSNWSVLVIGLSIFSQFSIGSLYVSISLSISSILSNLLVYNMIFLISLWYLLTFFSLFLVLFVSFLLDESS